MNRLEHLRRIAELRETRYYQQNVRRPRIFRDRGNPLDVLNDEEFRQRYRMTRPMFFELVNSVQFDLKYDTKRNHALTAAQQLMIALRFFASGSFQQVIGDTINVNKSTVCRTIARVTKALLKQQKTIIFWPTQEECARSALKLHENNSFPCVEGIVDGTHIPILRPNIQEEAYVNRKDFHSINVQICGNGDLQIIDVVAKWPGSVHDSRILKNSKLYEKFREGELPSLPNGVILGDSGYPLLEWLLFPFVEHPGMTAAQKLYNKAHKSARAVIERIIGILKRRWACLNGLRFKPGKCCEVIVVCCMLYNFCRNVFLNDDEEEATGDSSNADEVYQDDINETEEGRQKRDEFVRSFST